MKEDNKRKGMWGGKEGRKEEEGGGEERAEGVVQEEKRGGQEEEEEEMKDGKIRNNGWKDGQGMLNRHYYY